MARPLSDREYAECFNVFRKISTEWGAMEEWLRENFLPCLHAGKSADILSVGSGTGDFDLALMRLVGEKVSRIAYTALDPNKEHNRIFRRNFRNSDIPGYSLKIIPMPFGRERLEGTFDIVHLTHCLYYIPDRKEAIRRAYELLNPGGSLLIFHQTALGINEIQRAVMRRVKGDEKEMFSSYDILKLFEELNIPYRFDILISDIDVTDCVKGNETGNRLLCFFLESHVEDLEDALREEIIRFIKDTCRRVDGRYLLFHPSGVFWIKKEGQGGDSPPRDEKNIP